MKKKLYFAILIVIVIMLLLLPECTSGGGIVIPMGGDGMMERGKPVIYLYPPLTTQVAVRLEYSGALTATYPQYNNGWEVTAHPDGTLVNHADGKEYSYLFWEGEDTSTYDFSKGFVVKGSDTAIFLQSTLADMGLLPKEYNEMIVYWLPHMQKNPYNLISFQTDTYIEAAKLHITPTPDSVLRVFMAFKPLQKPVTVPNQTIIPFERKGFTVVEWGGGEAQ